MYGAFGFAVYSEKHAKPINIICDKNTQILKGKASAAKSTELNKFGLRTRTVECLRGVLK